MSSYGPSGWDVDGSPPHVGKMHRGTTINRIGIPNDHSAKLKARMKADDSDSVNMSDRKLGNGVRLTGSTK